MRRIITEVLIATLPLAGAASRAAAQEIPDPSRGYVVVIEPADWTGIGTRGIVHAGQTIRVIGTAYHPSGIQRVLLNGTPASITRERSGATRFVGTIPAVAATRDVEIVAYPASGQPIVRIQKKDGTIQLSSVPGVPPQAAFPAGPASAAPQVVMTLGLDALPAGMRQAVFSSIPLNSGIVAAAPGSAAHLAIRPEGQVLLVVGPDGSVRHRVPAPSDAAGAAALLPLLQQELGARRLAELPQPASTFALRLSFTNRSHRFRVGDAIEFRLRSERDGYLAVLDLGTDGTISLLYPGDLTDAPIRAGEEVVLPTRAQRDAFAPTPPYQAAEPTGRGHVRAFVTPRPLRLQPDASGALTANAVIDALRAASATDPAGASAALLPWATSIVEYRILP